MKTRLVVMSLVIGIIVILGPSNLVLAIDYPTRSIELIVPFGAGGSFSMGARILAQGLSENLGRPVVIINKPGVGGATGASYAAKAKPDGYTLFSINAASNGISPAIRSIDYKNSDFELIGQWGEQYMVLEVRADAPWKTAMDLIEYAKKNPGVLKSCSTGVGSSAHLALELFKLKAGGLKIDNVPFKSGSEEVAAVLGGHVQMGFPNPCEIKGLLDAGRVRILAVLNSERIQDFPDVPTLIELGFPVGIKGWYGLAVPLRVPKEITTKLKDAFAKTCQNSEVKNLLRNLFYTPVYRDSEEFNKFVKEMEQVYIKLAKEANIKVE